MGKFIKGKKTYAAAAAMVGLAAAEYFGVAVPQSVWLLLNGLGLGFLRSALPK